MALTKSRNNQHASHDPTTIPLLNVITRDTVTHKPLLQEIFRGLRSGTELVRCFAVDSDNGNRNGDYGVGSGGNPQN